MQRTSLGFLAGTFAAALLGFGSASVGGPLARVGARELIGSSAPSLLAAETSGPLLRSVSPAIVTGFTCRRVFVLSGEGLRRDDRIVASWSDGEKVLAPEQVQFLDSTKIEISINTGDDPDRWTLKIQRGPGMFSNAVTFDVKTPSPGDLGSVIGKFNGVEARSNGICTAMTKDIGQNRCDTNYLCDAPYQCVEYVKRYYEKHFSDIKDVRSTWENPNVFFERPEFSALKRVRYQAADKGACQLPQSGDMIFFQTNHEEGHVAIVTEVGDQEIGVIQQNMDRYTAAAAITITRDLGRQSCQIGPTMTFRHADDSTSQKSFPVLGWISPKQQSRTADGAGGTGFLKGVDFRNFTYDLGDTACGDAVQKITGRRSVALSNGRYLAPRSGLFPDFHVGVSEGVAGYHDVDRDGETEAIVMLFCGHALRNWALPIVYRWEAGGPSIVAYLAESHRALGGPTVANIEMSGEDLVVSYRWRKRLFSEAYEEASVYRWVDGTLKRLH